MSCPCRVSTVGLLSFWLCGSSVVFLLRACVPPKYFRPVNTRDSCFALTRNLLQASFAVPSLKYFRDNFSHTAAVRILVDRCVAHALGRWHRGRGALPSLPFPSFPLLMTGPFYLQVDSRIPRGCFNCTRGRTAPFMTVINVVLSVILASAATFAQTSDRCWCTWGPHVRKCL